MSNEQVFTISDLPASRSRVIAVVVLLVLVPTEFIAVTVMV